MFCKRQNRGMGRVLIFTIIIFTLLVPLSCADVIVVDTNAWCFFGSCIGACESGDYETNTIADGLSHAKSGDVVKICPGTYEESNLLVNVDNLTILGLGGSPADVEIKSKKSDPVFFISNQKKNITIQNLYIYQKSKSSSASAIYSSFVDNLKLEDVKIKSKSYGIVLDRGISIKLLNTDINARRIALTSDNLQGNNLIVLGKVESKKGDALNIGDVGSLVVSGSNLKAKDGDDIWLYRVDSSLMLINDTFDRSRYEGVYVNDAKGKVIVDSCVFKENRNYGLYIGRSSSGGNITNNVFYGAKVAELHLLGSRESAGFIVENNCFEKKDGYNVINRDRTAKFQSNYYNDYSGSGSYEIPDIPLYDTSPENMCHVSILPTPIASWRMDACSWNGTQGEVKDSVGVYNGTSVNARISQGFTCNGADLTGGGYISFDTLPNLNNDWTLSLWVKFPLIPLSNQFQSNGKYYFILASVGGTGDLGYFSKDKNGNYYFGVYDNSGNIYEKKLGVITDGWHRVTLVGEDDKTLLYIDGQYRFYVESETHGSLYYIGSSTDYPERESLNTQIDEVLLFNRALTSKQIGEIYKNDSEHRNYNGAVRQCPACVGINHYEIIHPQVAFTCEPATVTIKACANQSCTKLYTGSVNLTLNWDGQSEPVSFSGGSVEVGVSYDQEGSVDLSVTDATPTPQNRYVCYTEGSGSQSCQMTFQDAGFVFKTPSESDTVVDNTISCKSTPVEIYAVVKDNSTHTCATPNLNGNVQLNMYAVYIKPSINPAHTQVQVNGTPIVTLTSPPKTTAGTPVVVSFSNGVGTFNMIYPDAGEIQLYAVYKGKFTIRGKSNAFVVKPYRFKMSTNKSDYASGSHCTTDSCWANIGVFSKAGEHFTVRVKAECKDGTVTKNFNDTTYFKAIKVSPDAGKDNSPYLAVRSVEKFTNGVATIQEAYKDVGIINLIAIDKNYLGGGEIEGSLKLGRFVPDHFYVKPFLGVLKDMCTTFNYVNQPITGYKKDKEPYFDVIAQSVDNITTPDYMGDFFKLNKSSVNVEPPNGSGIDFIQGNTVFKKGDGIGVYKFDNDTVAFRSDVAVAPFTPRIFYTVNSVEDSDGVACINCPVKVEITGDMVKYGRIKIFDNFGPTTLPLNLDVQTQYWNGSKWVENVDDICTVLKSSYFALSDYRGKIKPGMVKVKGVNGITEGSGSITISAPGKGNYGSVRVDVNGAPFCNWLCTPDTGGTAFFGLYRGNDRLIEWRVIKPE